MELKLNVYKGRDVEKTYTTNDFALYTKDVEDILQLIDVDMFTKNKLTDEELNLAIMKIVSKALPKFKPIVQSVFNGLSDEEYGRTKINELGNVIFNIFIYAIEEMFTFVNPNSKN